MLKNTFKNFCLLQALALTQACSHNSIKLQDPNGALGDTVTNESIKSREPSSNDCINQNWSSSDFTFSTLKTKKASQEIKLNLYSSRNAGDSVATVIFFHGFADTMINHGQLFKSLVQAGYRVVGFDYPGHGPKDLPSRKENIALFAMEWLAAGVSAMLDKNGVEGNFESIDLSRPIFLAGWSTGGTLALEIAHLEKMTQFSGLTNIKGVVAIAPGIPVAANPFPEVTNQELTSCHDGMAEPVPNRPIKAAVFSLSLLSHSEVLAKWQISSVPTLIFTSNPKKDRFVKVASSEKWIEDRKSDRLEAFRCDSRHGIEFEPNSIGDTVRKEMISFLDRNIGRSQSSREKNSSESSSVCTKY